MKRYKGNRSDGQVFVTVDGRALDPRFDLRNHSPTGFEWGYGGSGPAQLALALLANHLENDDQALRVYQEFKFKVVANLPHSGWTLSTEQIREALTQTADSLNDRAMGTNARTIPVAVFRLGRVVATPSALRSITQDDILLGIQRHQAGDWGDLEAGDREANDRALTQGGRILSAYNTANSTRFWIITEADRSVTTVLLPEDY